MTNTKNSDYKLKSAAVEDIPLILQFIRELAEFEKLSHQVSATEEDLKNTLFGKTKYAEVVIGYYKGEPVSFALFFYNYSTFLGKPGLYLEDLYVKPSARGRGLGKILISYLARLAKEKSCGRFEWWCLNWNRKALNFYKSIGAEQMDEWTVLRVTGDKLKKLSEQFGE